MRWSSLKATMIIILAGATTLNVHALAAQGSTAMLSSEQLTKIIELIVLGIISAALIISVLVLFLGRWAGRRERKALKAMRLSAETDRKEITQASSQIFRQKEEASELLGCMKQLSEAFNQKRKDVDIQARSIFETSKKIKMQEQALIQTTNTISLRMNKIQSYWDSQLNNTIATIQEVQSNLDKSLNQVDQDLESMQEQKMLSQELLQDFLLKHKEQADLINHHSEISEKVGVTLEETLRESTQLVGLLKQYQHNAEKSLQKFTDELVNYEEQAYEQFDSSFQVADLARQELAANIDESRTHIESMRRHEEQSQQLNKQMQKNLEVLDYSKIIKISNTLDSAQDMFTDLHHRVEDTKKLLDELKDIETEVKDAARKMNSEANFATGEAQEKSDKLTTENLDLNANVYKMASGDNTPLSFFSKINKKDKQD